MTIPAARLPCWGRELGFSNPYDLVYNKGGLRRKNTAEKQKKTAPARNEADPVRSKRPRFLSPGDLVPAAVGFLIRVDPPIAGC